MLNTISIEQNVDYEMMYIQVHSIQFIHLEIQFLLQTEPGQLDHGRLSSHAVHQATE